MKVFKIFLSKQWIFTIKTLRGYAVFDRLFYNTCTIEQNKKPLNTPTPTRQIRTSFNDEDRMYDTGIGRGAPNALPHTQKD